MRRCAKPGAAVAAWCFAAAGTAIAASTPSPPPPAPLEEYECALIVVEIDQQVPKSVPMPQLKVLEFREEQEFRGFINPPGVSITGVACDRSSIVPASLDYRIVAAGYPFMIRAGERLAALQLEEGRLTLRLLTGPSLAQRERAQIATRLEQLQVGFEREVLASEAER